MNRLVRLGAAALAAAACGVATAQSPHAAPTAETEIKRGANPYTETVALKAWRLFLEAWETGEWQPFLDMTTDRFQFHFPAGPRAGAYSNFEAIVFEVEGDKIRALREYWASIDP